MVHTIVHEGQTLAIILPASYRADGIKFFTPDDFSQQLAYMNRPNGYVISPHVHNPVTREVEYTKEVLFIRSGRLRIDFYDDNQAYLESRILQTGDVEGGLRAAASVGDDTLEKQAQGYAVPDSFTHGTSAQRDAWFKRGLANGDMDQCDTFGAGAL